LTSTHTRTEPREQPLGGFCHPIYIAALFQIAHHRFANSRSTERADQLSRTLFTVTLYFDRFVNKEKLVTKL